MVLGAIVIGLARIANAVVFALYYIHDDPENREMRRWHFARALIAVISAGIAFWLAFAPDSMQPILLVLLLVSFIPDLVMSFIIRRRLA